MDDREDIWTGGQARSAAGAAGHARMPVGTACRVYEAQAKGRRVEARTAQVEQNKAGSGYGGLRALVRSPGHHIQDGGHEGAFYKGIRPRPRRSWRCRWRAGARRAALVSPLYARVRPQHQLGNENRECGRVS